MEGSCLGLCVCSRDLVELNPPEREKEVLQYAAWGPQGNQLVSLARTHLLSHSLIRKHVLQISYAWQCEEYIVNLQYCSVSMDRNVF